MPVVVRPVTGTDRRGLPAMLPLPQSRREQDPVSGLVNCASYAAPDHAGERAAGSQLSVYPHCLISVSGFCSREKSTW